MFVLYFKTKKPTVESNKRDLLGNC